MATMNTAWLKQQFKLHPDKSKAELARALNLEPPAISKILSGARQIKAPEYGVMLDFFGVNDDSAPLAGHQMQDSADNENSQWAIPADILQENTNTDSKDVKNFRVDDNMMAPEFNRGEYVVVDTSKTEPSPPGTFLVSDGINRMLRNCELVIGSNPAEVKISAQKDGFQPQKLKLEEFQIIGRVVAKLQWL